MSADLCFEKKILIRQTRRARRQLREVTPSVPTTLSCPLWDRVRRATVAMDRITLAPVLRS